MKNHINKEIEHWIIRLLLTWLQICNRDLSVSAAVTGNVVHFKAEKLQSHGLFSYWCKKTAKKDVSLALRNISQGVDLSHIALFEDAGCQRQAAWIIFQCLDLLWAGRRPAHRPHLALGVYTKGFLYRYTGPNSVPRWKVEGHLTGCSHVALTRVW